MYDVSDMSDLEKLKRSELVIQSAKFCSKVPKKRTHQNETSSRSPPIKLTVSQVLKRTSSDVTTRLLDSKFFDVDTCEDWISFNVRSAVAQWISDGRTNHGLLLRVTSGDKHKTDQSEILQRIRRHLFTLNENMTTKDSHGRSDESKARPYLLCFSDVVTLSGKPPRGKTATNRHVKRSAVKKSWPKEQQKLKRLGACRRRPLYIDFSDVGWNDWIVAPVGYTAYYCHGDCPTFMHENINYTNHAVIQSFVHSIDPTGVPKPCCVPTKLSSIPMLYVDNLQKVVLKNYEEMVVEACGCR